MGVPMMLASLTGGIFAATSGDFTLSSESGSCGASTGGGGNCSSFTKMPISDGGPSGGALKDIGVAGIGVNGA